MKRIARNEGPGLSVKLCRVGRASIKLNISSPAVSGCKFNE
jgi:hypothetical protein